MATVTTITGGGTFTAKNISDINANFLAVSSKVDIWVRPQATVPGADGSYAKPYATMAAAFSSPKATHGVVVGLEGVLREQFTAPLGVNNCTIIGAINGVPRQATTSGVANGGGATWLAPSSPVTSQALIRVQAQGWVLAGIYFNSAGITTNGCIEPHTVGDPPLEADGSSLLITGCVLTGAKYGIRCPTGTNYVRIVDSEIFGFGDSGDVAISATGSIGTLLDWYVLNCKFFGNANHIIAAASRWTMKGCQFDGAATVTVDFTNGVAPNFVQQNVFAITAANFDPAGGVTGVSGDAWSNYLIDAVETGLPTN